MKSEKIINVACLLFRQKGTQGVSTQDIAVACGISKATLFKLFESKEVLIESVVKTQLEKCEEMLANQPGLTSPQSRMDWLLDCSIRIGELFPTIFYCNLQRYYRESFELIDNFIKKDFADSLVATLDKGKLSNVFDSQADSLWVVHIYCWQIRLAISDTTISEIERPELYKQLKKFFVSGVATRAVAW